MTTTSCLTTVDSLLYGLDAALLGTFSAYRATTLLATLAIPCRAPDIESNRSQFFAFRRVRGIMFHAGSFQKTSR